MERKNEIAESVLARIQAAYDHAIKKHPVFDDGKGIFYGVSVLIEEVGEVAQALNDGNRDHAVDEIFQVIAVCLRLITEIER